MSAPKTLRFYASPAKYLLLLAFCVALDLLYYKATRASSAHVSAPLSNPNNIIIIMFLGLATSTLIWVVLLRLVLRRPMLQVDDQGWTHATGFLGKPQTIAWQDIASISIAGQWVPRAGTAHWLIIHAKEPDKLPYRWVRMINAHLVPAFADAALSINLNSLFLWGTSKKAERVLQRIRKTCAHEIHHYHIKMK